ncbi:MAG TPA: universal stress protein [Cyclobacteriaceae bacterium]
MKVIKKILAPTDFSKVGNNSVEFAAFMADKLDAQLIIPFIQDEKQLALGNTEINFEWIKNNFESLDNNFLVSYSRLKKKFESLKGDLVDQIKKIISERDIDIVVVGTKSSLGNYEMQFGSVTAHLIDSIQCPLIAIPEGYISKTLNHISIATDFNIKLESEELFALKQIVRSWFSKISLVHVIQHEHEKSNRMVKSQIDKYFEGNFHDFKEILGDDLEATLDNFADEEIVDLLVLFRRTSIGRERFFDPRLTKKMIFKARYPLMVLPISNEKILEKP